MASTLRILQKVSESCCAGTRLKCIGPSALAADLPRSGPLTVALMQGSRKAENTGCWMIMDDGRSNEWMSTTTSIHTSLAGLAG